MAVRKPTLSARAVNTAMTRAGLERSTTCASRIRGWRRRAPGLDALPKLDGGVVLFRYGYSTKPDLLRPSDVKALAELGYAVDIETGNVTLLSEARNTNG